MTAAFFLPLPYILLPKSHLNTAACGTFDVFRHDAIEGFLVKQTLIPFFGRNVIFDELSQVFARSFKMVNIVLGVTQLVFKL